MLTTDQVTELTSSLAHLRQHAFELKDIETWLTQNARFLGDVPVTFLNNLEVTVSINPENIANQLMYGKGLEPTVTLRAWDKQPPSGPLIQLTGLSMKTPGVKYERVMALRMPFEQWAISTAWLCNLYLNTQSFIQTTSDRTNVEARLNTYLPVHFPGCSLTQLQTLKSADLLSNDRDGLFNLLRSYVNNDNTVACTLPSSLTAPE